MKVLHTAILESSQPEDGCANEPCFHIIRSIDNARAHHVSVGRLSSLHVREGGVQTGAAGATLGAAATDASFEPSDVGAQMPSMGAGAGAGAQALQGSPGATLPGPGMAV